MKTFNRISCNYERIYFGVSELVGKERKLFILECIRESFKGFLDELFLFI